MDIGRQASRQASNRVVRRIDGPRGRREFGSMITFRPMTLLYYSPGSASLLVHWLLIEFRVPYELRLLDFSSREQKSAEYLALNPSGVVPTLVLDGRPMVEAAAIAMYLGDAHPGAGLAPAPGDPRRRDYLQWMFHLANVVQPLFRIWWYPQIGRAHV